MCFFELLSTFYQQSSEAVSTPTPTIFSCSLYLKYLCQAHAVLRIEMRAPQVRDNEISGGGRQTSK